MNNLGKLPIVGVQASPKAPTVGACAASEACTPAAHSCSLYFTLTPKLLTVKRGLETRITHTISLRKQYVEMVKTN